LRFGFYTSDGLIPSSAAVARAVTEAAAALRSRGAEVVAFSVPGVEDAIYSYFAAVSADGGRTALGQLEGGPVDDSLESLRTRVALPAPLRRAAAEVAGLAGEHRIRRLLEVMGEKSVAEYWRLTAALRDARVLILAAMRAAGVDLLLCPPHATAALPHGLSRDFVLAGSPSMLWNMAQFPAGVVPVTRVRPSETRRDRPRDRLEKRAAEVDRQSAGLPVGVQVVGRPWEEDRVLAAMIAIEEVASQGPEFPKTPVEDGLSSR
jgi:fatty acid amide hydrolase